MTIKPCKHATPNKPVCNLCSKRRKKRNEQYKSDQRFRDRIKKCARERYRRNPGKWKATATAWRIANRERYLENGRSYYRNNIAKFQARANLGEEHRKKERERVKAYNKTHSKEHVARTNRRRAIEMGVSDADLFTINDLIARDGLMCFICGLDVISGCIDIKLLPSIEHTKPLIVGGKHKLEDAALAHFSCNCSKGRKHIVPGEIPVRFRHACRKRIAFYIDAVNNT